MWNLVLTAVNEFSLALQEIPTEPGEADNGALALSCSPFVEVLNSANVGTSPESSEDTVTIDPSSLHVNGISHDPVENLDPLEPQDVQYSQAPGGVDQASDTPSAQPPSFNPSIAAPAAPAVAPHILAGTAASVVTPSQPSVSAKQDEMSWLCRKLQTEVDLLRSKVDQLQRETTQLQEENARLKRNQQGASTEGLAQKVADLRAENQLLRVSLKKMLDQTIASQSEHTA